MGVLSAGLAAVLIAVITSIPSQIIDPGTLGDLVRNGDDIEVLASPQNDDEFSIAMPGPYDPPPGSGISVKADEESALALDEDARAAGGYDYGKLKLRIQFEGRRNQTIQIYNLLMTDVQNSPAARGTLFDLGPQGKATPNEKMRFSLSENFPQPRTVPGDDTVGKPYFEEESISLDDREQVTLLVEFDARPETATDFKLEVRYVIGGQPRRAIIDNHGSTFKVSGYTRCFGRLFTTVFVAEYTVALRRVDPGC